MSLTVRDATERNRYEAIDAPEGEGTVAGFTDYRYRNTNNQIVLTHTEVSSGYEGQGVGGQLVQGALDDIRAHGLRVVPVCSFVEGWIQRHPEYADLVDDSSE